VDSAIDTWDTLDCVVNCGTWVALKMPLVYIHGEQSCAITYSSRAAVCFSRNIFTLLFVTRLSSMSRGMCMVVYRVGFICMYTGST
jgi:hypothetical protein